MVCLPSSQPLPGSANVSTILLGGEGGGGRERGREGGREEVKEEGREGGRK